MKIEHVALFCESQEKSDRFYGDLLGLKKTGMKSVPADLMNQIFGIRTAYTICNYTTDTCYLEIFIGSRPFSYPVGIEHLCLNVGKRKPFLEKCRHLGVKILQIPKPDGPDLIFITDFDGNRFEIKGD